MEGNWGGVVVVVVVVVVDAVAALNVADVVKLGSLPGFAVVTTTE